MRSIESEIEAAAVRWLGLWRFRRPMVSLPIRFMTRADGCPCGALQDSSIEIHLIGDDFEHAGVWMQTCRVQFEGMSVGALIATLAGLPALDDCIVVLCEEPRWHGIMTAAMAVLAAHLKAASALKDVEALQALDPMFAAEQVALLEADILSAAQDGSAASVTNAPVRNRHRRI